MTYIPTSQYDIMGDSFKKYEGTPAHIITRRTILDLVGDVRGQSVLDLGCGYGFWGRELKRAGAARVVGVDISKRMIALAREESQKHGDDVEFYVGDANEALLGEHFDLVVAICLFNYAETLQNLQNMFRNVAGYLHSGGRLVAQIVNPDYQLNKGNFNIYGATVLEQEFSDGKYNCKAMHDGSATNAFKYIQWSQKAYEDAIKMAGFSSFYWKSLIPQAGDIDMFPKGFWDNYRDNCLFKALVCKL